MKNGEAPISSADADVSVLKAAVAVVSGALDELVGECLDIDGMPKAPSPQALMRARGMLPPRCSHALAKAKNK